MPAGMSRVKVEFAVDADGILKVTAEEEHTGATATVDVQPSYGLSDDEVERMLDDAIDHAEDDIDERLLIDARIEGEQILHSLRKALDSDSDLLEGEEQNRFSQLADDLDAALKGTDRRRIQELGDQLDQLTAPFAQRRIERDLARAIRGRMADNVADTLGLEAD
jgi:molecular chaperone HscA